jgi:hypothetical protein
MDVPFAELARLFVAGQQSLVQSKWLVLQRELDMEREVLVQQAAQVWVEAGEGAAEQDVQAQQAEHAGTRGSNVRVAGCGRFRSGAATCISL